MVFGRGTQLFHDHFLIGCLDIIIKTVPDDNVEFPFIRHQGEYPRLKARDESDNSSTVHHQWQGWIFHRSQLESLQDNQV